MYFDKELKNMYSGKFRSSNYYTQSRSLNNSLSASQLNLTKTKESKNSLESTNMHTLNMDEILKESNESVVHKQLKDYMKDIDAVI